MGSHHCNRYRYRGGPGPNVGGHRGAGPLVALHEVPSCSSVPLQATVSSANPFCQLPPLTPSSLIALAVLRLHYVGQYTHSTNAGLAQEPILVIQQVYLCWSIISATIPNLKSFVRSFGSGFGIGLDMERYTQAYGSKGSYGKQYALGSMKNTQNNSRNNTRQDNTSYNDIEPHAMAMNMRRQAPQTPHRQENESIESVGSQERIIRKDVGWRIHYENENDHRV